MNTRDITTSGPVEPQMDCGVNMVHERGRLAALLVHPLRLGILAAHGTAEILPWRLGLHGEIREDGVLSQWGMNTGVYSSKQGPGGNLPVQNFHSQGPVGDFEGLIMMTWYRGDRLYKGYVFGNGFPGCIVQSGQFEKDVLVFRSEFSAGPTKMSLRGTTRSTAPGKIDGEEYISTNGGPEVLMMRVEATKR